MAFWKKKGEDPWDIDPNRKREPVIFYERAPEPRPDSVPAREEEGLAMPEESVVPEKLAEAPACPWCGQDMTRAYLLGGRDRLRLSDQKPTPFWGSLGHSVQDISDDGLFTTHKSCWMCTPCRKLVADIPEAQTGPNYAWENGKVKPSEEGGACWDGSPVGKISKEEVEE